MQAYVSLGSNLGSPAGGPRETVLGAAQAMGSLSNARALRCSRVYRSSPWGPVEQPDFANAVVGIEWSGTPFELLSAGLELERQSGRERRLRWGPRTLDVDLLLFGEELRQEPGLELPHPRLHERRFVLVPLVELEPELRHPRLRRRMAELLEGLPDQGQVEPWEAVA